jgi:NADH-quinone oxidoreductase subunit M
MSVVAGLAIILGAAYMLWMYQRTVLGKNEEGLFADLSARESIIALCLMVFVIWIGVYPNSFLNISDTDIRLLVDHLNAIH